MIPDIEAQNDCASSKNNLDEKHYPYKIRSYPSLPGLLQGCAELAQLGFQIFLFTEARPSQNLLGLARYHWSAYLQIW